MKIGIIGAGSIGLAWAKQFTKAGYSVVLSNSRGPESLAGAVKELGGKARAGTVREAAAEELVLVAVPWAHIPAALAGLPPWKGRIVMDANNPIIPPGFSIADLGGRTSSEVFAGLVPGAKVVKAGNTLQPGVVAADARVAGGRRVQFLSGDDAQAKELVAGILQKCEFATIDLGDLAVGGRLQQFPGGPFPALNLIQLP
jgi:predicted dinucleotide-binding enzyme